jgi:hypothetical protein
LPFSGKIRSLVYVYRGEGEKMKRLTVMIGFYLALAITGFTQSEYANVPPIAQPEECPAKVTHFRVEGGWPDIQRVFLFIKNNADRAIESIEYQFEAFDYERQRTRGRYYLAAGKITASPGKPIQPGQTKSLSSIASSRFGLLYRYRQSDGEEIKINVLYFTDGTKWERKGWKTEPNPNG